MSERKRVMVLRPAMTASAQSGSMQQLRPGTAKTLACEQQTETVILPAKT
jgi:hypothetical protein